MPHCPLPAPLATALRAESCFVPFRFRRICFFEANTASNDSTNGKTTTKRQETTRDIRGSEPMMSIGIHRQLLPDPNVALKSSILWLRDHAILMLFLLIGSATA